MGDYSPLPRPDFIVTFPGDYIVKSAKAMIVTPEGYVICPEAEADRPQPKRRRAVARKATLSHQLTN